MAATSRLSSFWKLIICVLGCEAVGIISGLLSQPGMNNWFENLNKPSWNPPSFIFGPVWTLLYLLMGVSLWLIWKSELPIQQKKSGMVIFALQLLFNFWWSILFFAFHEPLFALFNIAAMLIAIILTIFHFAPISRVAAWLLVPYVSWVSFATILNYTIWSLN